jgi:FtsP/CotA-like multicopper oxidase with cupredoxin domain
LADVGFAAPEISKGDGMTIPTNEFPRETSGLPAASATAVVQLSDGDRFALRIAPVSKRIGDATVRMLAYNGSIPGPTLRVPQGSELLVDVDNQGDMEATVHWHGLRLENRFDGTHETPGGHSGRRALLGTRRVPRPRRLLVPPAHSRGLQPGDGAVRQRRRRPVRPRLLAGGSP